MSLRNKNLTITRRKNEMQPKVATVQASVDELEWKNKYILLDKENLKKYYGVCPGQSKCVRCETPLSNSPKWKNRTEAVISQTNNKQNLNNINANKYGNFSEKRRRCRVEGAIDVEIIRDHIDVTERSSERDCVQSTNLRHNLSKSAIRSSSCSSCEGNTFAMTYQNSQHRHHRQSTKTRLPISCRCQSNSSTQRRVVLTEIFIRRLLSLYLNYFIRLYGKRKMFHQLPYAIFLLFLISSTSVTNAELPHRRHSIHGGTSLRHPRHSGFRRNFQSEAERCETITIPTCRDIGYNETDMSLSFINKYSQLEAQKELDLFRPLIRRNCSTELKLFLCSIYTPICMKNYNQFLPPCRFICERAKSGCLPIMERYHQKWPNALACEQFPRYTKDRPMCMHFNLTKTTHRHHHSKTDIPASKSGPHLPISTTKKYLKTTQLTTTTTGHSYTKHGKTIVKENFPSKAVIGAAPSISNDEDESFAEIEAARNSSMCICSDPMVTIRNPSDPLYNRVATGGVPNCAVSCKSPYFSDEQIDVAQIWIKSWSIVCFVVTLMTVSTFLIDMERFKYPERPIIFLSTCYMFVSVGFLIRIIAGHEAVACASRTDHVLYHTTGPVLCTVVFLLVYFFGMASSLWWVILSMTWFLASGLKWGSEAIEKYSQYYHAAAWLIPSLKSIMILAMSSVDGDSLSGICYVGNQDVRALRGFVLAPLVVYLTLGGMFLFAGFISLFRIRSRIKQGGTKTDKLEKLMGRIGVFSVLYMVPAAALVACYFYEQQYRPLWEYSHNCKTRYKANTELSQVPIVSDVQVFGHITPEFVVFMVRYFMTLLIGITNGVWICSPKTLESWKKFYRRCICFVCATPNPIPGTKDIATPRALGDHNLGDGELGQLSPKSETSLKYSKKSIEHCKESENNRCDLCLERSYDSTVPKYHIQNNYRLKAGSGNSSSSKHDLSCRSKNLHRIATCEICDRSSRSSSINTRGKRSRKRREMRSRSRSSEVGSLLEKTRVKSNRSDTDKEICCSNTTSTDGSDHLNYGNGVLEMESKLPGSTSSCTERMVENQDKRGSCDKTEVSKHVLSKFHRDTDAEYVINHDDLFPTVGESLDAMRPNDFASQKSHELPHMCDCDDEKRRTSFPATSLCETRNPVSPLPHYHHYHHHYH